MLTQKTGKAKSGAEEAAGMPLKPASAGAKRKAGAVFRVLRKTYPEAHCELEYHGPFQLLAATILSAQCTDKLVNQVTPGLFHAYPDAASLAKADPESVEHLIRRIGLFRTKARNLVAASRMLVEKHGGKVPKDRDSLTELAGVGRKTANVVLSNAFGMPALPVDTHVLRVGKRLGLFKSQDPVKVEAALMSLAPLKDWGNLSHWLIWHGRRVCSARSPNCAGCSLKTLCPSAFKI
jgi:endonuclease-3